MQLVLDEAANAETVALLTSLAKEPLKRNKAFRHYRNIVVRMDPAEVETIAARPDVISIAPYVMPEKLDERQGMIVAGQLAGNGPSAPGYLAWLASKGFTQQQFTDSGLVVDVCDSGMDNGTTNAEPFRPVRLRQHGAGQPRGLYPAGGHAQHRQHASRAATATARSTATSSAATTIAPAGFPHQDSAGYRYGLGIAPFVKLGSSVIFDPRRDSPLPITRT